MRKWIPVLMVLLALLAGLLPAPAAAAKAPKLFLDGNELRSATPPRIDKDTTFVPIRTVAEGLGFDVTWDKASKVVGIYNGSSLMELTIGKKSATVDGKAADLAAPAKIVGSKTTGTTMVPLRFVSENMGLSVFYDAPASAVYLYQPQLESLPGAEQQQSPTAGIPSAGSGLPAAIPDPMLVTPSPAPGNSAGGTGGLAAAGSISGIEFDGAGATTISYSGTAAPAEPFIMTGPDRIIMDFPGAAFGEAMTAAIAAGGSSSGEIAVNSSLLTRIRYGYLSNKPDTVRVVWDLPAASSYTVDRSDGTVKLILAAALLPALPIYPTTPSGETIFKVVIDAGHGNQDPGAIGLSGSSEKNFNLSVALKLNMLLQQEYRIQPVMTRYDDTFVPLEQRAAMANAIGADLFLSIHANSGKPSVSGTETYYTRADSKALADVVHRHLLAATGLADRKVKSASLAVTRLTTMPAVLTESGFLSHPLDEAILLDDNRQNAIAQALKDAVKEYLQLP